jgi:hypothetical protein
MPDDEPVDVNLATSLEAIDAALAGEPVDPEYADIAELSLLLAAERPEMESGSARSLDERVQRRFAVDRPRSPRGLWRYASLGAAATAAVAALLVVINLSSVGGSSSGVSRSATAVPDAKSQAPAPASAGAAPGSGSRGGASSTASSQAAPSTLSSPGAPATASPQPPANGRQLEQSAELALTTPPNRIDDVAQEVFNLVGARSGIVSRSTVTQTGGTDGSAQIELRVPSAQLGQTMAKLSRLPYAHVSSRTDAVQDVTDQYSAAVRRLADARALRTALLHQLANATTSEQVASLNAQMHDAEASISSDRAALGGLSHQIAYSRISLSIYAGPEPVGAARSGGGFTIGTAAHDASRVLVVAAGVALIALAGSIPAALVAAVVWWIALATRRHRREKALDMA